MEQTIQQPFTTSVTYAGFWVRASAFIADLLIAGALSGITSRVLLGNYYLADDPDGFQWPGIVFLIVNWLYFSLQESSARQATIGKLSAGIKVCTENYERLSFANATGRFFAKILSAAVLFTGFIMVAFNDKKRGLHDRISKTFVIYR
ncbi:MAG: RDD family protein [Chitinophagaceae bacterium]|nr:RDD family protein [Chitinophagaceae bacterium]